MRKIMVLTAVVAALGMASEPAEARDRGLGFRHFSGHAGPKLHLRHPGFQFQHGGLFETNRAFKSRHVGHFRQHGFASKFGHVPHFKPRQFEQFGHVGLVLKFGDGNFVLRSGHAPFKDGHFSHTHSHRGLLFGFHNRSLPFEDRRGFHAHRQSMPRLPGSQGGGLQGGAPPEALLESSSRWVFDTCQSYCAA